MTSSVVAMSPLIMVCNHVDVIGYYACTNAHTHTHTHTHTPLGSIFLNIFFLLVREVVFLLRIWKIDSKILRPGKRVTGLARHHGMHAMLPPPPPPPLEKKFMRTPLGIGSEWGGWERDRLIQVPPECATKKATKNLTGKVVKHNLRNGHLDQSRRSTLLNTRYYLRSLLFTSRV